MPVKALYIEMNSKIEIIHNLLNFSSKPKSLHVIDSWPLLNCRNSPTLEISHWFMLEGESMMATSATCTEEFVIII